MSTVPATHAEILYKIGSIEEAIKGNNRLYEEGFSQLSSRLDQILSEVRDHKVNTNQELVALKKRVDELETFKRDIVTRVSVIVTGAIVIWTLVSPVVYNILGRFF